MYLCLYGGRQGTIEAQEIWVLMLLAATSKVKACEEGPLQAGFTPALDCSVLTMQAGAQREGLAEQATQSSCCCVKEAYAQGPAQLDVTASGRCWSKHSLNQLHGHMKCSF